MDFKLVSKREGNAMRVNAVSEDGRGLSGGSFTIKTANLNGKEVNAMLVGGIGTAPENRRFGLVRNILHAGDLFADSENCPISVLHPFSFAYYRKFGYERVSDTKILEFPMTAISYFPRYEKLLNCSKNEIPALDKVYNEFAKNRNLMFKREGNFGYRLGQEKTATYLSFDEKGEPDGYITYNIENYFYVNKMVSVNLNVLEMAFTSPEALDKLFGFMRMFEGQLESIKIHDAGMMPEVERKLRNYHHTKITIIPDIMARVNDVEAVLKLADYPARKGEFTVKVYEPENTNHSSEKTSGVWNVKYENKAATVTKLSDDSDYDLKADIPAFTQLIFGYEVYGINEAKYINNTEFKNDCEDFFRVFRNRPAGVFEHF